MTNTPENVIFEMYSSDWMISTELELSYSKNQRERDKALVQTLERTYIFMKYKINIWISQPICGHPDEKLIQTMFAADNSKE